MDFPKINLRKTIFDHKLEEDVLFLLLSIYLQQSEIYI